MNILHICENSKIGGDETNLINLLSHIDRWEFNPHVIVFSEGELTDKLSELNISFTVLPSAGLFTYQIWRELRTIIADRQVDLVHAHGPKATFHSLICTRGLKLPVVRTIHRWSFCYRKNVFKQLFYRNLEKQLVRHTTANIAVSQHVASYGKQCLGLTNVELIPNGVDTDRFHPASSPKASRASFGIPASRTVVGFISRLSPQKDPLTLIRAFAQAQKVDRNLHLVMLGRGELKKQCLQEIEELGIKEFTTCISFHPQPSDILKLIDIFCLPTHFESLPQVLLEAMAMKCAVVTTPVRGNTEIVAHEVDGLLAPIEDIEAWAKCILRLHHNPNLRKELGQRARMVVEYHHNIKSSSQETQQVYRKLYLTNQPVNEEINYDVLRQA